MSLKRIDLSDRNLQELHAAELELLCEFRRICHKNKIHYNIIAGTLLGAVRHKGFIPWDDDADVALLRDDYIKFVRACKVDLNTEKYYFQDMETVEGYRWGYGKLRLKNSKFIRLNQEHMPYEQGIFIDIFPLDCVPDHYVLRSIENFRMFILRKLLWSEVGRRDDKHMLISLIYKALSGIPFRFLLISYKNAVLRASKRDSQYVRILTFPTPNKVFGYPKHFYLNSLDYEFCGEYFKGIAEADAYLSFKYGDYMVLPPVTERKAHPVSEFRIPRGDRSNG